MYVLQDFKGVPMIGYLTPASFAQQARNGHGCLLNLKETEKTAETIRRNINFES